MAHLDDKISVILFYADWCGHCKTFKPNWDEWSKEFEKTHDDIQFNSVEDKELQSKEWSDFKISGFPTLMMIKNDKQILFQGPRTKELIEEWIDSGGEPSKIQAGGGTSDMCGGGTSPNYYNLYKKYKTKYVSAKRKLKKDY